ncbi:tripartite tricarboxylate transporter substrate-binding protein [Ornithinimicrobium cerasi]|uniref:Tripartite-type tricarboxylate transporter, receptor component TctC n=1 Tax=Ornithinimicrobium cerasi TaxID=2248773 RepID=A0A285VVL2_9MICO|nr:tripartite tricarboxylate transporter substrate-binding protein [Ornithinimicrobium cerasi]SOC56671.1 Tripartite-type tricarboxylate transporter, receptor component TctC [Ornithinimicrobium cerasi]
MALSRPLRAAAALTPLALVLAACGDGGGDDEAAANYPEESVSIIVPFSAGGPTDTVTRLIAEPMAEALGQQVLVENVEGAGGTVAGSEAADADPDGYTVLMHHIGMSTAPTLYEDLPYDPLTDFETVGLVTEVPMTIIARSDFEPETMEDLITYLQENADSVNLANAGVGAASQLCGLLLQDALGVELNEVPYDGTGPAMTELVGGQVDLMCDQTTNTTNQINAGEVKAYAVTTPDRIDALPDVPTAIESGLDLEVSVWHGLYVPAETPEEIVTTLTEALQEALTNQTVIDEMAALGTAPVAEDQATPEAHTTKLEEQIDLWAGLISPGR